MDVEVLDHVVVTADSHAPRVTDDDLLNTAHLDAADVDPAGAHVEAGDAVVGREVEEIEDRLLARIREVLDRLARRAAPVKERRRFQLPLNS